MDSSFIVKRDDLFEFDYNGLLYIAFEIVNEEGTKLFLPNQIFEKFLKLDRLVINKIFKERFESILISFVSKRFPNIATFVVKESDVLLNEDQPLFFFKHQEYKMLIIQYNLKILGRIIDSYLTAMSFTSQKFKMGVKETLKSINRENDEIFEKILKRNESTRFTNTFLSGRDSISMDPINTINSNAVDRINLGFDQLYTGRTFIHNTASSLVNGNNSLEEYHTIGKIWNDSKYLHMHLLMCYYKLIQIPLNKFLADGEFKLNVINVTILADDFITPKFQIPSIKTNLDN